MSTITLHFKHTIADYLLVIHNTYVINMFFSVQLRF